ncbi:hypothetical protein D3C81_2327760 [compost metagenome]
MRLAMVAATPMLRLPHSPSEKRLRASMSKPSIRVLPRFLYWPTTLATLPTL